MCREVRLIALQPGDRKQESPDIFYCSLFGKTLAIADTCLVAGA